MDKYKRQIERSKLWARRRNSTADILLQGQLRYLEHGRRESVKHHRRHTLRLEAELHDISSVSRRQGYEIQSQPSSQSIPSSDRMSPFPHAKSSRQATTPVASSNHFSYRAKSQSPSLSRGQQLSTRTTPASRLSSASQNINKAVDIHSNGHRQPETESYSSLLTANPLQANLNSNDGESNCKSHNKENINESISTITGESCGCQKQDNTSSHSSVHLSGSAMSKKQKLHGNTCRFSPHIAVKTNRSCCHFPCSLPSTYHALGFRRDDIHTWSLGDQNDDDCINISKFTRGRRHIQKPHRLDHETTKEAMKDFLVSDDFLVITPQTTRAQDSDSPGLDGHSCARHISGIASDDFDILGEKVPDRTRKEAIQSPYRRASGRLRSDEGEISGSGVNKGDVPNRLSPKSSADPAQSSPGPPGFVPRPADPLLERVRQGWYLAPRATVLRQAPRRTVEGRLRGLQALVSELRAKHEKARPVDWAVNYGQRLPMRMLLNPVAKVH